MKTHILAPFAVIALWLGLSSVWMAQTGSTSWASDAAATDSPAMSSVSTVAAVPLGPVMIDLSLRAPLGPVMTELLPTPAAAATMDAPATTAPAVAEQPAEPTLARLQALEARLSVALAALERQGSDESQGALASNVTSILAQLVTVVGSAPVIGFLLMLLLVLAVATREQPLPGNAPARRLKAIIHRLTAPADLAAEALVVANPLGSGTATKRRIYGQTITHIQSNGQPIRAGVFNENQVRAAAGLTLALGAVALAYAFLGRIYLPIQVVTTLFFAEFLIRVTWGITRSPLGLIAGWMTPRQAPHWVSAKPKRFAWSLGLVMSLAMMIITNSGIRGPLPLTICLICLTLMWLEAVLGLCLGCEIHRHLVRLGWIQPDKDFEICSNGACTGLPQPVFER